MRDQYEFNYMEDGNREQFEQDTASNSDRQEF